MCNLVLFLHNSCIKVNGLNDNICVVFLVTVILLRNCSSVRLICIGCRSYSWHNSEH